MSVHDYSLSNQSGASFRSDLNNALAAILSNNSNASSPSTTVAYSIWADTNAAKLKIRNSANDDWVDLINLDGTVARDLTFTGASANIVFDQSDNALEFADDAKATFGTGADLTISHNGSNSIINDSGTGELQLQRAGDTILALNSSGIEVTDPSGTCTVSIKGFEGGNANLSLKADEADDNGDTWLLSSTASDNSFHIYNDESGGTVSKFQILTDGRVGIGLTPNTSDVATNVSAGLIQTDGNIDIRYAGTNSDPAGARYLNFINTDTSLVTDQPMGGLHFIGNDSSNPNRITASILAKNSGSTGTGSHLNFSTDGSVRLKISRNGDIGAPSGDNIFDASDERLKENMLELTDGLNKINKLKPISYNYKVGWNTDTEGKTKYGFGAQTTEKVDKLLVESFSDEDVILNGETISNPLRVNEKFIIPLLVKAIQELTGKVEALETKVAALEAA